MQVCAIVNERRSVNATIVRHAVERTWGLQSCEGTILTEEKDAAKRTGNGNDDVAPNFRSILC